MSGIIAAGFQFNGKSAGAAESFFEEVSFKGHG